ncbi:MAG: ComEC family competence protein [Chitinophagales bacterium]|nr:ComEC family competence protein [Chitinophagales bacterium]
MKSGRKFLLTNLLYLKVFIAFTFGIISSEFISNYWVLISLPFLFFVALNLLYFFIKVSRSKFSDSFVFCLIFSFGIFFHSWTWKEKTDSLEKLKPILEKEASHIIRLEDKPLLKANSLQLEATLLRSQSDTGQVILHEKILIYLPKDIQIKQPYYGQILQVEGRLVQPSHAHYVFEFDYAKWLERNGIYATLYSKDFSSISMDSSSFYQLSKIPFKLRDYFENEIDRVLSDKSSNAIAKSILIGIRSDVDRDLYTAYADTGTIHILSISGLHFGILILFLEYLLSFAIKKEGLRLIIKHSVSFLYALMTGFSAPIMRSFIMFLFFDFTKWKQLRVSSYNILFLSAWLILLFDTHQLFNIGYQFSYCALLGIMLIYHRAIWKIQFGSFILNFIWKSTVTLLAAWLFTAPLTIFYYHKFSWFGSLSNILVVPLTTLIMYVGFIFILFSKLDLLSNLLGDLLTLLIKIQNTIIAFFSQIPYASIHSNILDIIGLILLFALIGFGMSLIYSKTRFSLRLTLICTTIFTCYSSFHSFRLAIEENWFLVSNYKHSAIAYKNKNQLHIITDTIDDNMQRYFFNSLESFYNIDASKIHSSYDYIVQQRNKFSYHLAAQPQFLVLAKENKEHWDDYIEKRDSFVLVSNIGYRKSDLINTLKQKNKHYHVY